MNGSRIRRTRYEVDDLRALRIAHVQDRDAVAEGVTDVSVAAMDHDLDAVTPAALIGVAYERDVARGDGVHPLDAQENPPKRTSRQAAASRVRVTDLTRGRTP